MNRLNVIKIRSIIREANNNNIILFIRFNSVILIQI